MMNIKKYQIQNHIATDPFSNLYTGEDSNSREKVVIRILSEELAKQDIFVQLFHSCAENSLAFKTDCFTRILSHGTENSSQYIIYEYFDLIQLSKYISINNVLSIFDAPAAIEKIAIALRILHIEGGAHGTLSPDCVFFDKKNERVKIANYGFGPLIQLMIRSKLPTLKNVLPYLSPEFIAQKKPVQRQSDVFSLGALFYRLLIGSAPWSNLTLEQHLNDDRNALVPPSLQRLEIPDFLDSIILEAMEANINERCSNLSLLINKISEAKSNILASFTPTSAIIYDSPAIPNKPEEVEKKQSKPSIVQNSEQKISTGNHIQKEQLLKKTDFVGLEAKPTDRIYETDYNKVNESSNDYKQQKINNSTAIDKLINEFQKRPVSENKNENLNNQPTNSPHDQSEQLITGKKQENAKPNVDYKESLLHHEEDFFNAVTKPETRMHATPKADINLEAQASAKLLIDEKQIEKVHIPLHSPTPELLTDEHDSFSASGIFKTHKPAFPVIQINEFEDRLPGIFLKDKQIIKESRVQSNGQPPRIVPQPDQRAKTKPEKDPEQHYNATDEFDEFDEKTATATEEYAKVKATHKKPKKQKTGVFLKVIKKIGIPIISLFVMYFLITVFFKMGVTKTILDIKKAAISKQPGKDYQSVNSISAKKQKIFSLASKYDQENELANLSTKVRDSHDAFGKSINSQNNISNLPKVNSGVNSARINSQQAQNQPLASVSSSPAQLNLFVRNGQVPKVADVYIDGNFYGKTNNQGKLLIDNMQLNKSYLVKVQKDGYEIWAKEIILSGAYIEAVDINLEEKMQSTFNP